jgi:signal transduction histidine kinase
MLRKFLASAALLVFFSLPSPAAEFGTAEEARAMLDRVIEAVKADPAAALDKFNKGEDNFRDRDLYPFCNNADGTVSAHENPGQLGKQVRDIKDVDGKSIGDLIMGAAKEGQVNEVSYKWPRPGTQEPVAKMSFVTKIGDLTCGVGFYPQ